MVPLNTYNPMPTSLTALYNPNSKGNAYSSNTGSYFSNPTPMPSFPTGGSSQNDFINNFANTIGLAPMKAYNDTIGWNSDSGVNSLDQSYNSPLKAQYDNFINTQLKPDFQMHTYAPAVKNYGINNNTGGGYLLGDNADSYNNLTTGLQRQYTGQAENAYNFYNDRADQNYQNGLSSYYVNNPNAFTNRDPNADTTAQPAPAPVAQAPAPQQAQAPQSSMYTAKNGDTLWGVYNNSYKNKMNWGDFLNKVKSSNNLGSNNWLYTGRQYNLPG